MSPEYPYQIVAFIDKEPSKGEAVYQGKNGWYPHVAIKRRFTVDGKSDKQIIDLLENFFKGQRPIDIQLGELMQPEGMPVRVIPVLNNAKLIDLHLKLIEYVGEALHSRYPERDGANYFPHITTEYKNAFVIDVSRYEHSTCTLNRVCLIKDAEDNDSHVLSFIDLQSPMHSMTLTSN